VADPFYDKDLVEESLGRVIKRTRFMVSNDFNTPRVRGPVLALKAPAPSPGSLIGQRIPQKVH